MAGLFNHCSNDAGSIASMIKELQTSTEAVDGEAKDEARTMSERRP